VSRLCLWRLGHVCWSFLLSGRPHSWSVHHVMELGRRIAYGDAVTYAYQNNIGRVLRKPGGSLECISRPLFYHTHLAKYNFITSSTLKSGAYLKLITSCIAEGEQCCHQPGKFSQSSSNALVMGEGSVPGSLSQMYKSATMLRSDLFNIWLSVFA